MTETSPPYGDPPAPSTRITEADLLRFESPLLVAADDVDSVAQARADLVRAALEIRRYRALLLGLASFDHSFRTDEHGQMECRFCECALRFARRESHGDEVRVEPDPELSKSHREDCPWPALEAEVQAIRKERR